MLRVLLGVVLVGLGSVFMLQLFGLSVPAFAVWPVVLGVIGCGVAFTLGSRSSPPSFGWAERHRRPRAGRGIGRYDDHLHGGEHWVLQRHYDIIQRVK